VVQYYTTLIIQTRKKVMKYAITPFKSLVKLNMFFISSSDNGYILKIDYSLILQICLVTLLKIVQQFEVIV
jgi:hypothetical protein